MQKDLQIDYLAYGFLMSRRCYLFPWLLLQAAWRDHQGEWLEDAEANRGGFKVVRAQNPTYVTKSIAIPIGALLSAVAEASVIDLGEAA